MDAGLYPTKFTSKMFLPYCERKPEQIYSGDIVRIKHVESNCYMQTAPKLSGTRSMLPPYPDFLLAEIAELKN